MRSPSSTISCISRPRAVSTSERPRPGPTVRRTRRAASADSRTAGAQSRSSSSRASQRAAKACATISALPCRRAYGTGFGGVSRASAVWRQNCASSVGQQVSDAAHRERAAAGRADRRRPRSSADACTVCDAGTGQQGRQFPRRACAIQPTAAMNSSRIGASPSSGGRSSSQRHRCSRITSCSIAGSRCGRKAGRARPPAPALPRHAPGPCRRVRTTGAPAAPLRRPPCRARLLATEPAARWRPGRR
jgi:hypothetical protein